MIEISDPQALAVLDKKFHFSPLLGKSNEIFTPGFVIKGGKGYGTTSFVMTNFPGSMVIFSYDGQTEIIKQELAKSNPELMDRIVVRDLYSPVFTDITLDDQTLLEVGYKICDYVLQAMKLVRASHIVHERIPVLNDRVEKYARYLHFGNYADSLTAAITGNDLRLWGFRNRFYDQLVGLSYAKSDICPIVTTYPQKDYGKAFGDKPLEEPDWHKTIMAHFRNVVDIKMQKQIGKGKPKYYAYLESMKGTDFGETGELIEITGYKVIFPPEKFERYKKNNPFGEVKNPVPIINEDLLQEQSEQTKGEIEDLAQDSSGKDLAQEEQDDKSDKSDDILGLGI